MAVSFKKQLLISSTPYLDFLDSSKVYLPVPFWFLPNSFPELSESVVLNTLFKLASEGLLKRSYLGKTKYIGITTLGLGSLTSDVENYNFLREIWDGKFRIVFFDIPESERKLRDLMRAVLSELGFVNWQRSVFISTHSVEGEVMSKAKRLGVEDMVNVMLIDKIVNRNVVDILWDLYNLKSINERYNIFISQADHLLNQKSMRSTKWVEKCQELRFTYYDTLREDPFLPKSVLGEDFKSGEASKYFVELGKKLVTVLERV